MKILQISDVHGRECIFDILKKENPDLTVFTGDFVSTHDNITEEEQINVCNRIFEYKEKNSDKVILLRGNHDVQHVGYSWAECTGYCPKVGKWLQENKDRWLNNTQWIYIQDNILFSHAGVSTVWIEMNNIKNIEEINKMEPSPIFEFTPDNFSDYCGTSKTQPPTWIRQQTLVTCAIPDYIQVVGHTPVKYISNCSVEVRAKYNIECPDIWLTDCLPEQYLIIEDGSFIVKNLK